METVMSLPPNQLWSCQIWLGGKLITVSMYIQP